ncbi:FadR/GntR family transcriptional regulator [Rubrobacter calidifluminis]|uniref:FadR/GntR family transcriptional regulator n=1 Tax=Rubrobacter calidifluminis TaxID=1392640 RepID=UPI002362B9C3|nr:FadR/GntR family transcriptional regulator [Rubrobacter calidifluminis]
MFKPVSDSRAYSEKIVSQITDAIVKGDLKPGDRMPTERDLAEQFGVSRTVVRDAVKTLAGRGILRVKQGAGIFVATPEEAMPGALSALSRMILVGGPALRDHFEVRKILETQAAEWAAERAKDHHLERLQQILNDAFRYENDPEVLSERDARFHTGLAEASGNLVLVRVMLVLLDLLSASRRETLSIPGRARQSLEDHVRILEQVKARNPAGARQAMLDHLESVETSLARIHPELGIGVPA